MGALGKDAPALDSLVYIKDGPDAKSFLKKMGTAMPELDVKKMLANYPLAWDVDKTGKVLWREQFGQGYAPKKGQLREQLRRHCGGEGMLSNGKKPVDEESDEDLAEGAEMDCDYDSDLGF